MSQYDNTNRGALFKAKEKRSENSPDYTGRINVDGKDWSLSAWIKESKAGQKYMSIAVREPLPQQDAAPKSEALKAAPAPDFNDELPESGIPF